MPAPARRPVTALLAAALALAATACDGARPPARPSAPPGPALRIEFAEAPAAVAFQDGEGPWREVEWVPGPMWLAVTDPEGRYGLMVGWAWPTSDETVQVQTLLWQTTLAERPAFDWGASVVTGAEEGPALAEVRLTLAGLDPAAQAINGMLGGQSFSYDPGAPQTTLLVAAQEQDLTLISWPLAPEEQPKALVRRAIEVTDAGLDLTVDLAGLEPLGRIPARAAEARAGEELITQSILLRPGEGSVYLANTAWQETAGDVLVMPPGQARVDDLYWVWLLGWDPVTSTSRCLEGLLGEVLLDGVLTLPPPPEVTVAVDAAGRPAWRWSYAGPEADVTVAVSGSDASGGRDLSAFLSKGWLRGRTSYDLRAGPALPALDALLASGGADWRWGVFTHLSGTSSISWGQNAFGVVPRPDPSAHRPGAASR